MWRLLCGVIDARLRSFLLPRGWQENPTGIWVALTQNDASPAAHVSASLSGRRRKQRPSGLPTGSGQVFGLSYSGTTEVVP